MATSKRHSSGREAPEAALPPLAGEPPGTAGVGGNGQARLPEGRITEERRQLPSHEGKLARIQSSAQGAVESLREWVDLRIELVKTEIHEAIQQKTREAKFGAIMAVFGALAAFFLLLALGFLFSTLLEAAFGWAQLTALTVGYTLVCVLLAAVAGIAYLKSPFRN